MTDDTIKVVGIPTFTLQDQYGNIKQHFTIHNLVTTVGKNLIADRLISNTPDTVSHMALGTSNATLSVNNTELATELTRIILESTTRDANVLTYSTTFTAGVGTGSIVEAGLFTANTAGVLLCRTTFPAINKEPSDILTVNWNVTIS